MNQIKLFLPGFQTSFIIKRKTAYTITQVSFFVHICVCTLGRDMCGGQKVTLGTFLDFFFFLRQGLSWTWSSPTGLTIWPSHAKNPVSTSPELGFQSHATVPDVGPGDPCTDPQTWMASTLENEYLLSPYHMLSIKQNNIALNNTWHINSFYFISLSMILYQKAWRAQRSHIKRRWFHWSNNLNNLNLVMTD